MGDVGLSVEDADPRVGECGGDDLWVSLDLVSTSASDDQKNRHRDLRRLVGIEGLRTEGMQLSGNRWGGGHPRWPTWCRLDRADLLLGYLHEVPGEGVG